MLIASHTDDRGRFLKVIPNLKSYAEFKGHSAIHPSGIGKWVIHVIRYMDYGMKA